LSRIVSASGCIDSLYPDFIFGTAEKFAGQSATTGGAGGMMKAPRRGHALPVIADLYQEFFFDDFFQSYSLFVYLGPFILYTLKALCVENQLKVKLEPFNKQR